MMLDLSTPLTVWQAYCLGVASGCVVKFVLDKLPM